MSASKVSTASNTSGSTGSAFTQPSETSDGYFPKDTTASSLTSGASTSTAANTPLDIDSPTNNNPLSPLDRNYSKPLEDPDIAQLLSKQPTYWSVRGWVQRSASSSAQPVAEDLEAKTRKFEETKKDLLDSVGRF